MENKTAKFVAHPSYLGGGWGLQDTEVPERMKDPMKRRQPDRVRELLVQTILILRGQRFPSVFFRQWVSGIQPAGDGGEHRPDSEGFSF